MDYRWLAQKPAERGRPTWGFCRVQVETLCRLWSAYRAKQLKRQDMQVWFAAHELAMRRCSLRVGRRPSFSKTELEPLTGMDAKDTRASIRRLEAMGFLLWSGHELLLKEGGNDQCGGLTGLPAMLALVTNHRRTLPIPRHTVLLLARTRRPVFIATVLGHLIRCMYYRSRECFSWGTCKSSWIATVFGVDVRNVKAVRGELEQIGWIRRLDSNHWHRQRYGGTFIVSLAWTMVARCRKPGPIPPQRDCEIVRKSPPPDSYRYLPSEIKNQNRQAAAGVHGQKAKSELEPRLVHVLTVDLTKPERTNKLFQQAVKAGLVKDSIANRLQFFAAAKRAGRLGYNPGGFFISILRKQLWRNIASRDEEQARTELSRIPDFNFAEPSKPRPPANRSIHARVPKESMDSSTIRELIRVSLASVA